MYNPSDIKRRREREEEEERRRAFLIADGAKADTAVTISVGLVMLMLVGFLLLGGLLSHAATGTAQASSGTSTTQSNPNAQATADAQASANAQATATAAATPKQGPLTVPFSKGLDAAKTTVSFSGPTKITVSGTGQSAAKRFNDAFYIYTDPAGHALASPEHTAFHDLCINGKSVESFVYPIPAYNSSHTYTFTIAAAGGSLTFGVCDTRFNDNTGSFTIMFS